MVFLISTLVERFPGSRSSSFCLQLASSLPLWLWKSWSRMLRTSSTALTKPGFQLANCIPNPRSCCYLLAEGRRRNRRSFESCNARRGWPGHRAQRCLQSLPGLTVIAAAMVNMNAIAHPGCALCSSKEPKRRKTKVDCPLGNLQRRNFSTARETGHGIHHHFEGKRLVRICQLSSEIPNQKYWLNEPQSSSTMFCHFSPEQWGHDLIWPAQLLKSVGSTNK